MDGREFLTVDSGGSKTKIALYSMEGNLIKTTTTQGFGKALDSQEKIVELFEVLKEFCNDYSISTVICNLGGKNKREFELTLQSAFPNSKIQLFRESEGKIGMVLCEKYGAQVTLMAGTGSIAIAPVENQMVICGGWGANISDQGSGYQVGLDAIRLALEQLDQEQPLSLLTKKITGVEQPFLPTDAEKYCSLRDTVRQNIFPLDRAHIASFAKVVCECAFLGDKSALNVYEKAGKDLANIVLSAGAKTKKRLERVVVTGGMVNAKQFWSTAFEKNIKEKYKVQEVIYIADGIDVAMCEMARK